MMKYKVGDIVRFVKKCTLSTEETIYADSVWRVKEVTANHYVLEHKDKHLRDEMRVIEHDLVDNSCEKINTAPSITKHEKHNILNGLTKTDTLKPDYYKYRGGDVFDIAKHFELDYPLGSALKYLLRAGHKNPAKKVEDLQKCIECIKRHIELEG